MTGIGTQGKFQALCLHIARRVPGNCLYGVATRTSAVQDATSGLPASWRSFQQSDTWGVQLEVLNTLEKNDAEGRWHCVNLLEWFDYRGHVCMAFEKLGLSLYDFLRRNGYTPFHVNLVSTPMYSTPSSVLGGSKCMSPRNFC